MGNALVTHLPGLLLLLMLLTASSAAGASAEPPGLLDRWVDWVATGIEVVGIAIIVVGALITTMIFLRQVLKGGHPHPGVPPVLGRPRPSDPSWARVPRGRRHYRHSRCRPDLPQPSRARADRPHSDVPELRARSGDSGALAVARPRDITLVPVPRPGTAREFS
jgi:hypothetical protein